MKIKIISAIVSLSLAFGVCPTVLNAQEGHIIYVDCMAQPDGDGSEQNPFSSIAKAKDYIRTINSEMTEEIRIIISGGRYYLDEALVFNAEDSGKNGFNVIYEGKEGETVEISGGMPVNDWESFDKEKNIYRAYVGKGFDSRGFFVNGEYKQRARSNGSFSGSDYVYAEGTTEEQKQSNLAHQYSVGYKTTDTFLNDFKNQSDMEVVLVSRYRTARCLVEEITEGEDGYVNVIMNGKGTQDSIGWYNVVKAAGTQSVDLFRYPLYYENAYELLDEAGEWYINKTDGYIYYMPETDEDINTLDAVLGKLENIVTVSGTADKQTDFSKAARNITFKNVNFCHSDWDYIENAKGVYFEQANTIKVVDVKKTSLSFQNELPVSAVTLEMARNISFDGCGFYNLVMNALKMTIGVQNSSVTDCRFYDIGGNAVNVGEVGMEGTSKSANYKYNAQDNYNPDKAVKLNRNILINNNTITRVGLDSLASVGIMTGYLSQSEVSNNEIYDVPYTAIHAGWGWEGFDEVLDDKGNVVTEGKDVITRDFVIKNNYIHNHMNSNTISDYKLYIKNSDESFSPVDAYFVDGGGIYFFGKTSGSENAPNDICGNYITEQKSSQGYLYADRGASNYNVYSNVIDARKSNTPWYNPPGVLKADAPYWSYLAKVANNINYYDNYSTTASYSSSMPQTDYEANSIVFETPEIHANAGWSEETKAIIEAVGVNENKKSIQCDNYIFNGGFDDDLAVWDLENPDADIEQIQGTLKVKQTDKVVPVSQTMLLDANTEYIFRARVRSEEGTASVRLTATDSAGTAVNGGYYPVDTAFRTIYLRYKSADESVTLSLESSEAVNYYIDDVYAGIAKKTPYADEFMNYYYDNFESTELNGGYYTNENANKTSFEIVNGGANGSTGALLITQNEARGVGLYKDFYFEGGKTYNLSCYIKAGDNTVLPDASASNSQKIALKIDGVDYHTGLAITHDWQKIEMEYTPEASGTKCVQINPAKHGYTSGNGLYTDGDVPMFYYDDLCISESIEEEMLDEGTQNIKTCISDEFDEYNTNVWKTKSGVALSHSQDITGPDGEVGVLVSNQIKNGPAIQVELEKDKAYVMSVWAKASAETAANVKNTGFNFYFSHDGTSKLNHRVGGPITADWQQYVYYYKHTQETVNSELVLYMESSSNDVELYYDKFELRELGADVSDDLTGTGFWEVSNSNYGEITGEEGTLKVHMNRNNFSPAFSGFAFESGEKYEISFKMRTSDVKELGTPALMVRGFTLENSYNESTKSYEYNEGSYISTATVKIVGADAFGANENWQKFTFIYEPSQLTDGYVFSKIYLRPDNSAYNTESNDLTYYLDDFSVRNVEKESNALIEDGKITVKNQSGKLYHIMQSADGENYSSAEYDFADDIIEYNGNADMEYCIDLITVKDSSVIKKEKAVFIEKQYGTFVVTRPETLTLDEIRNGINVTARNSTGDTKYFDVAVAGYDEGKLKSVKIIPMAVPYACEAVKTAVYEGDAQSVKLMVLDIDTMIPLLDVLETN